MLQLSKILHSPLTFCKHVSRYKSILSPCEIQSHTENLIKVTSIPMALYGGRHTVTMIPGGGIGPECSQHVRSVFRYLGVPVDFEIIDVNASEDPDTEFENALISVKRNGVAIKGNIDKKSENPALTIKNVMLRNDLDLYVYVLCCKSYPGVKSKHSNVDIVIIRQNTEGAYSLLEHSITDKVVEGLKIVTKFNSLRIARYAFEYAKKNGRKKITTVHKANIMKLSDGLFLESSRQIAKEYPEIKHEDMIIDNCCMQLVRNPHQFDVMLTANLYGNIIGSVICGSIGGPGLISGVNYGPQYAIFEPGMRNWAEEIVGKNTANPVAMLNASVDMLYHLGHNEYARKIENAIYKTLSQDLIHTPDIGGTATSEQIVSNIIDSCLQS